MRVALDATPLTLTSGGLRRYTLELSGALAEEFPEDDVMLLPDAGQPRDFLQRRWWLLGAAREMRRRRVDLFHGTNFEVPYLPLRPSVLSLHDLSPWMDPAWHHAADRVRRRTPFLIAAGIATMVLTDSEAVRRQAIGYFRISPARIAAVPLAAAPHFRPVRGFAPEKPYFLFVGTLEPRKNLARLLEAWRAVRDKHDIDLVLAGRRRSDFPEPRPEPGLAWRGEVPEQDLPALYSGALACLYPSLYEGFGLPVLEAMQCGAAVIASRDPAISEVAQDAALLLDARDTRAWVEALEMAAERRDRLEWWRERAIARAREFSWARTARLTWEVYEEARKRFGSPA